MLCWQAGQGDVDEGRMFGLWVVSAGVPRSIEWSHGSHTRGRGSFQSKMFLGAQLQLASKAEFIFIVSPFSVQFVILSPDVDYNLALSPAVHH